MSSPKKNVAYDFTIALIDSGTGDFKASPTLATGDFQISKDGGAYTNLASLPTVTPAASINVKISLAQAEMNADKITVKCIDTAGGEWDDVLIFIDATVANVDDVVRSTTPANTLDVDAGGDITAENMRGTDGANTTTPLTEVQVNAQCDTAISDAALALASDLATVDTIVDAIKAITDLLTLSNINAEVVDVVKTDTINERTQGIPPVTPTFEEAIMYIYMMLRNKIDIDKGVGFKEFYNNAGTLIWKKSLSDDGTNYVEDKGESG